MIKTKLTLGTKLELELYDANGDKIVPTLISQFEAVLPDGSMEILSPILEGRIYPVHRGTNLDVIYEKNGDLYRFASQALGRKLEGNIHLLRIKPLSEVEKIQRRYFFRFNCVRDVDYRIFAHRETKEEERGDYKKGITKDISGGGICLCSDIRPEIGWYVEGKLLLNQDILFIGRVVRVINIHDRGKYNYEIGIEFDDISNMNRERIIGYIFEEQRKLLKKGWTK
jgi:c-di-GMP-binding flagellar brake protein YcgR